MTHSFGRQLCNVCVYSYCVVDGESLCRFLNLTYLSRNYCNGLQGLRVEPLSSGSSGERGFSFSTVESVIHVVDSLNDLTPFPWWSTLSLTAISLRFCLFPLTVKQVKYQDLLTKGMKCRFNLQVRISVC